MKNFRLFTAVVVIMSAIRFSPLFLSAIFPRMRSSYGYDKTQEELQPTIPVHKTTIVPVDKKELITNSLGVTEMQKPVTKTPLTLTNHSSVLIDLVKQHREWAVKQEKILKTMTSTEAHIYAVAMSSLNSFILLASGFRKPGKTKAKYCMVNGHPIPGKNKDANTFECIFNVSPKEDDVLSIRLPNENVAPSIARWQNRAELKSARTTFSFPLCIVTMVKNEEKPIVDWVEYYIRQGVGLFVIYNNNSTDQTTSKAKGYPQVMIVDWPWKKSQIEAFVHGVLYVKKVCQWVLLMDVDEYLFPVAQNASITIQQLIQSYPKWMDQTDLLRNPDDVDQICFESKVMGTSGYVKCPDLSVPEAYINFERWWVPRYGKCAVRTKNIWPRFASHRFKVKGRTVILPRSSAHTLHYRYQCWEYYITKYEKGRSSGRVKDWNINKVNIENPPKEWTKTPGPIDTLFRDYKREVDTWPLHR